MAQKEKIIATRDSVMDITTTRAMGRPSLRIKLKYLTVGTFSPVNQIMFQYVCYHAFLDNL
jgi:hypothetical protein